MRHVTIAAALLLAGAVAPLHGQFSLGVAGGPSTPVGGLSDVVNPGLHAGVVLDFGLPLIPLAVRGEAMFQRLPGAGGRDAYDQVWAGANGRFDVLPVPLLSAYVTGGAGIYSSRFDAAEAVVGERRTDTGINVGVGADLHLFVVRPFIEMRYHRVLADPARAFVPITVGIYF